MADKIGNDFELIVMSDLMWYVLPKFRNIVRHLKEIMSGDGWLLVNHTFFPRDKQKYGSEIVSSVE